MIKLNRTTEYGLMALRHMNRKRGSMPVGSMACVVTSAREIADSYGLPFEITAKTLQRLKDTGLIQSAQGARGGYTLQRRLEDVSLAEFLELMEGPQSVVACAALPLTPTDTQSAQATVSSGSTCEYHVRCEIKQLMTDLNERVKTFLSGIRLADLAGHQAHLDTPLKSAPIYIESDQVN
jgi:Rrf2 family protein